MTEESGGFVNVSRQDRQFDAVKVAAEAREIWGEIPQTPGRVSWQGTPMSAREARYRFEHVEPFIARLYRAAEIAEFDQEFVRQAMDAVLSPIPSRRRRQQRNRAMTEGDAINLLFKRGIATRSTAQVAAGGMPDLPYVRDIAAEHGITILEEGDEDLDTETDDDDEDVDVWFGEDAGAVTTDVTAPVVPAVWTVHGDIGAIAEPWVTALGELEEVARTHTANAGTYSYTYADLGDVLGQSRPVLARHGLALFQVPTVAEGEVSMATVVMHVSGTWLEFAPLNLPAGPTAQSTGSAATYGRRYSVMSILGLATEDNDGQTAGTREPPPPAKLSPANVTRFLAAAEEALLSGEEIDAVVLDATHGRTSDPAQVWVTEVDALRMALAYAARPDELPSDDPDKAPDGA